MTFETNKRTFHVKIEKYQNDFSIRNKDKTISDKMPREMLVIA